MATTTGNDYDHIDICNGTDATRHYLKDTTARTAIDNLVTVSSTQPSSQYNEIWVSPSGTEYQVPTYGEFSDLKSAVNVLEENLSNPVTIENQSVVTFDAVNADIPIETSCEILPAQTGSGDPSPTNIRPFTSISSITISHSGEDTSDPDEVEISFPNDAGTVYAGKLIVNRDGSADFVANTAFYTLLGTESWYSTGSAASRRIFYMKIGDANYAIVDSDYNKCSHFITNAQSSTGTSASYYVEANGSTNPKGTQIRIRTGQINGEYINTTDDFKTWLVGQNTAGTPVQCTVKLSNPTVYHFTTEQIKTFEGINKIWQSNGNVSVSFNLYNSEMENNIQSLQSDVSSIESTLENVVKNPKIITANLAVFNSTIADDPLEVACDVIPVQTGSGDPSPINIRPFSSISEVTLSHSGEDTSNPDEIDLSVPEDAGTVYGGRFVINPDGSADFFKSVVLYELDGTESWYSSGNTDNVRFYYFKIGDAHAYNAQSAKNKCSHFITSTIIAASSAVLYCVEGNAATQPAGSQIRIRPGQINGNYITTTSDWKAYLAAQKLAGTPILCTAELSEVEPIHFTSEQVKTLLGTNKIWQDGGTVSVTYNTYLSEMVLSEIQTEQVKEIAVDRIPWEFAIDHVICIGDSLTYGSPADSTTMPYPIAQNYPYYLGRMLGLTDDVTNAGTPNYGAKTWYNTNYNSYQMADYNAFIIFLGTNGGLSDTLETDVDPYSDYNDYTDNNTGCYCKLIEHILSDRPDALIVLVNTWHVATGQPETRTTIDKIGARYGLPVVETYDVMRYSVNPVYHGNVDNVHCSKAGYLALANLIRAEINRYIVAHPSFANLGMS